MPANLRPGPPFKQRFEFGALEVRGSSWATDWLHTVRGLNELAHTAGAPCAGAPASVPCRSKESKGGTGGQHLNMVRARTPIKIWAGAARPKIFPNHNVVVAEFQNTSSLTDIKPTIWNLQMPEDYPLFHSVRSI